jgi:carbon monoxide dehydrogenase subunit G
MKLEHEFRVPVPVTQAWDVLLDVERIAPCMPGATVESFDGETVHGRVKVKVGPIQVTYNGTARFIEKNEAGRRVTIDASGKEARGSGTAKATIVAVLQDEGNATLVNVTSDLAITGKPAQFGRGVMVEVGNKLLGRFADCLEEQIGIGSGETSPTESQPAADAASTPPDPTPAPTSVAGNGGAKAADAGTNDATKSTPTIPAPASEPTTDAPPSPQPRPAVAAARPALRPADNDAIDLLDVGGAAILKRVAPLIGVVVLFLLWRLLRRR